MVLAIAALVLSLGQYSYADSFTANFNSLASGVAATGTTSIQSYMQGLLVAGQSVTVTPGAVVTDKTYTGDNHVVGPSRNSFTLGTTNGATDGTTSSPTGALNSSNDTFIRNVSGITGWTFTFTGITVDSVSFDFEIFPDGTCPSLSNCGTNHANLPDFTFSTNLGTVFHYYAVLPGTATATPGTPLSTTAGWTSYSGSPAMSSETAPQLLGTTGTLTTNVAGATSFTFLDWPATIGIDNLTVTYHTNGPPDTPNSVPEPASMLLLGTGLLGLVGALRRKYRA
jgi:hypothetical protein